MKISLRTAIFAAAAAAAQAVGALPSRAATYGDQPWCAVHNEGGDNIMWDCEFLTVDDCSPAIIAGNRGFCARNPYWQPLPPQPSQQPTALAPPRN